MDIKLVAVDMDGTFLDSKQQYDRERFARLYQQMKAQDIHFVVASGNQYHQLAGFFEPWKDEIGFVAENGSWVLDGLQEVFAVSISHEQASQVMRAIHEADQQYGLFGYVICGKKSAYVLRRYSDRYFQIMQHWYTKLEWVDDFAQIDDDILKFAVNVKPEDTFDAQDFLMKRIGQILKPVTSGHGAIDLIVPGYHKAHGIALLASRWQLDAKQCVAFGDGENDIEMLQWAGYGYAMANASETVKAAVALRAPDHDQAGVLTVLEALLNKKTAGAV